MDLGLSIRRMIGIGAGSGAVFSPLPPQNATGNWIKIVQSNTVRVTINQEQLKRYPLRWAFPWK